MEGHSTAPGARNVSDYRLIAAFEIAPVKEGIVHCPFCHENFIEEGNEELAEDGWYFRRCRARLYIVADDRGLHSLNRHHCLRRAPTDYMAEKN